MIIRANKRSSERKRAVQRQRRKIRRRFFLLPRRGIDQGEAAVFIGFVKARWSDRQQVWTTEEPQKHEMRLVA